MTSSLDKCDMLRELIRERQRLVSLADMQGDELVRKVWMIRVQRITNATNIIFIEGIFSLLAEKTRMHEC